MSRLTFNFFFIAVFAGVSLMVFSGYANAQTNDDKLLINPDTPFILAVERDYPPFLFVENGVVQGIAYEYTQLIAEKLGKNLEETEPLQLQDMLDVVRLGDANLLADITETPERAEFLEFSDYYAETPAVVIARKHESKWNNSANNRGVKIAVGKGYGVASFLKEKYPTAIFIEVSADADVLRAVSLGASDVGVLDTASLSYLLQREPLSNIEVVGKTEFSYHLSFAVAKRDAAILPAINEAIANITDEEKTTIYSKWTSTVPEAHYHIVSEKVSVGIGAFIAGVLITLLWKFLFRKRDKQATASIE